MSINASTSSFTHALDGEWDVIVVGSGMGGLSAASTLAQTRALRCLVIEQHWTPGGMTHQFEREQKYWFSSGTHYVGQMGPESTLGKLMHFVTKGVIWDPLPDEFDVFHFSDGNTYRQPANPELWKARLIAEFPDEKQGILTYFKDIDRVYRWYCLHFLQQALGWPFSGIFTWLSSWGRRFYENLSAQQYFDATFKSDKIRGVLTALWGDYGLRPSDVTFMQHALITWNNFGGTYYPRLGSRQLACAIIAIVEEAGGRVITSTRVKHIVVEKGTAVGVVVQQHGCPERFVKAKQAVISACGAYLTFRKLLLVPLYPQLENPRLISAGYSTIALYVGLKGDPKEQWGIEGENLWLSDGYRHSDLPLYCPKKRNINYVFVCPSSQREIYARAHSLDLCTFTSYDFFRAWEGTTWRDRGQEYQQMKEHIMQDILTFTERWLPGLKDQVVFAEVGTPLTWKSFTGWEEGAIYGVPATPEKLRCNHILKPSTPIKNLYLAGIDANVFGVAGAMMSGVMAAGHLLYPRLGLLGILPEIRKKMTKQGWAEILRPPLDATKACLVHIQDETSDTRTLIFNVPPEALCRFKFVGGQYVTLLLEIHREEVRRPYSISSSPDQLPMLSVTVKRIAGGAASNFLHGLNIGDCVYMLPPAGNFILRPLLRHLPTCSSSNVRSGVHLFFAAGSGIAPIMPMLTSSLDIGEQAALLYCSRSKKEVIFYDRLLQLQKTYGQRLLLLVQHCYSKHDEVKNTADVGCGSTIEVFERLTQRHVELFLDNVVSCHKNGHSLEHVQSYLCGPANWSKLIKATLEQANLLPTAIHMENFSATRSLQISYEDFGLQQASRNVHIVTGSGSEQMLLVEPYQSVLDAALNAGVAINYSCRNGSCMSCAAKLRCGSVVDIEDGLVSEQNAKVLTCQVVPAEDNVRLEV